MFATEKSAALLYKFLSNIERHFLKPTGGIGLNLYFRDVDGYANFLVSYSSMALLSTFT